jgi:DNA-binding NarL/FixJ family response regulator
MDDTASADNYPHAIAVAASRPRVLVADDRSILRAGLRAMLGDANLFEVLGDERRDAVLSVGVLEPAVVVMDLSMPNMSGLRAIREIKRRSAQTKIVVLTADASRQGIRAALDAGADGYLMRETSREELVLALDTVLSGKRFISPSALSNIIGEVLEEGDGPQRGASPAVRGLSARQREVLKLIAEGKRNREIAEALGISVKTVEKHRSNVMQKLDLHNTAALTTFAIESRLIGKARTARSR